VFEGELEGPNLAFGHINIASYNKSHPGNEIESLHLSGQQKDILKCWFLLKGGEDEILRRQLALMETV
jgi:hypothetical protein